MEKYTRADKLHQSSQISILLQDEARDSKFYSLTNKAVFDRLKLIETEILRNVLTKLTQEGKFGTASHFTSWVGYPLEFWNIPGSLRAKKASSKGKDILSSSGINCDRINEALQAIADGSNEQLVGAAGTNILTLAALMSLPVSGPLGLSLLAGSGALKIFQFRGTRKARSQALELERLINEQLSKLNQLALHPASRLFSDSCVRDVRETLRKLSKIHATSLDKNLLQELGKHGSPVIHSLSSPQFHKHLRKVLQSPLKISNLPAEVQLQSLIPKKNKLASFFNMFDSRPRLLGKARYVCITILTTTNQRAFSDMLTQYQSNSEAFRVVRDVMQQSNHYLRESQVFRRAADVVLQADFQNFLSQCEFHEHIFIGTSNKSVSEAASRAKFMCEQIEKDSEFGVILEDLVGQQECVVVSVNNISRLDPRLANLDLKEFGNGSFESGIYITNNGPLCNLISAHLNRHKSRLATQDDIIGMHETLENQSKKITEVIINTEEILRKIEKLQRELESTSINLRREILIALLSFSMVAWMDKGFDLAFEEDKLIRFLKEHGLSVENANNKLPMCIDNIHDVNVKETTRKIQNLLMETSKVITYPIGGLAKVLGFEASGV